MKWRFPIMGNWAADGKHTLMDSQPVTKLSRAVAEIQDAAVTGAKITFDGKQFTVRVVDNVLVADGTSTGTDDERYGGRNGEDGKDGVGIAAINGSEAQPGQPTTVTVTGTDGSTLGQFRVAAGAQGAQGERGPQGLQGPQGEQGPPGADADLPTPTTITFISGISLGLAIEDDGTLNLVGRIETKTIQVYAAGAATTHAADLEPTSYVELVDCAGEEAQS